MTWHDTLVFLANKEGLNVAMAVALTLAAEYWPWFQAQTTATKQIVYGLACCVLPVLACLLGIATDGWPLAWEGVLWPAVRTGLAAGGGVLLARAGYKRAKGA